MVTIHPTALVDRKAELEDDVVIGPYAIVGPDVRIGRGTLLGAHALIERSTTLGKGCRVFTGAILGTDPQDIKFRGQPTTLEVGDGTTIREYATLNRATVESGTTRVGARCLLMAYVHVAHDCVIGDGVVLANAVNMAGHVVIEDHVTVGGITPIHQFVRIGQYAFIGGGSRVNKDVPPFVRAVGNPLVLSGLNSVGLARHGFPEEVKRELKRAYRLLFRSDLNVTQAIARVRAELHPYPEVEAFARFIETSERGITL